MPRAIDKRVDAKFREVIERFGGKTFDHGLYRVHRGDELDRYTKIMCEYFIAIKDKAIVFGSDWLGRQFAVSFNEQVAGKPTVLCLEPGVPDNFCTDHEIDVFHNEDLIERADAALAKPFFRKWRARSKVRDIPHGKCVGYKVPLFLGAKENVQNLELVDMEMYLGLCCQLWNGIKDLPDGTLINEIHVE
jgi:hypothetical protein